MYNDYDARRSIPSATMQQATVLVDVWSLESGQEYKRGQ